MPPIKIKYNAENTCAKPLKGYSAGHDPSQVKTKNTLTNLQKMKRVKALYAMPLKINFVPPIEKVNRANTAHNNAITPPNLSGIARRIA